MEPSCYMVESKSDVPSKPRLTASRMLIPPQVVSEGLELSVHVSSKLMLREAQYIFPHLKKSKESGEGELLIIPTIQKTAHDIVQIGPIIENEKDRCLEVFAEFARKVCEVLRAEGHWADFIDPCSGVPMLTEGCPRPYNEVDGFQHLLRYQSQNAGCCKILLHPRWGSSCYPATMFTTAPFPLVLKAIRENGGEGVKIPITEKKEPEEEEYQEGYPEGKVSQL